MSIKLRSGSQWKNINNIYLRSGGVWKKVTKAYVRSGGLWKNLFSFLAPSNEPYIAQTVELTTSSSSMPATLTGTNYHWTNATTLTYKFQYYNGSQWLDGNGTNATGTITNPSIGSPNTKLYTPIAADFGSSSSANFRFVVTATNTNVSPSLQTISTSSSVTISYPLYTVTLNGNGGTISPSTYYIRSGSALNLPLPSQDGFSFSGWYTASSGGTYVGTNGDNYYPNASITLYAQWSQTIYTITWNAIYVTNPTASTGPYGTVISPVPSVTRPGYTFNGWYDDPSGDYIVRIAPGGSWTITGSRTFYARYTVDKPTAPTSLTATNNRLTDIYLGWDGATGEITNYGIFWNYTANSSPSPTSNPDFTTNSTQTISKSYIDSSMNAGNVRYYWIRSQGPGGNSDWFPAGNGVYGRRDAIPVNTTAPSVSPTSGTAGTTTYFCNTGSWNPDDADGVYEFQWQYNDQGSLFVSIAGATSSSFSPPSNFLSSGYFSPIRCRVTASGTGANTTSNPAFSNTASVSAPSTPPASPPTPPAAPPTPPATPPSGCFDPPSNCPTGYYWDCNKCVQ